VDQMQIPWLAVVAIIGAIAAVQTLRLTLLRGAPSRRARARSRRAVAGESQAERLLEKAGFRIAARQPRSQVRVWVDREPLDVEVRGDLLVQKGRRFYLAEVKTGTRAPCITHGPTRRQLLEYSHAFDVDGLLLVDADQGTIRRITFSEPERGYGLLGWLMRS
jgi:hypothetical protein